MPAFFNDLQDDPLAFDQCPSFSGGQVSFQRANILQPNEASLIENFNIEITGELRKRRGSRLLGTGYVAANGARIQGLFFFDRVANDKLVGFAAGKAYEYTGGAWSSLFDAAITDTDEIIDITALTDKLYWTDSSKSGIRSWDGATVSTVATSPAARCLTTHGTRLVASVIPTVPDAIDFSDILDGGTWDSTTQRLRIGGGDGDPIVCHVSWQDTGIIVLKRNSTWLVDADPQVDVANFSIKSIHSSIGCVARDSVAQVGQDVWFLSRTGIQSVRKQLATSNNMVTIPVSQPVQDVINQIRWDYAYKSTAIFHNNRYMLSIPVADTEPNTVLVFNNLTGGWTIITGWDATILMQEPYEGGSRLLYGNTSGKVYEWLDYELEDGDDSFFEGEGYLDLPFDLPATIPMSPDFSSTLLTRAMTFSEPLSPKTGFYLELEYVTSAISFSVYAITDGKDPVLLEEFSNEIGQITLPVDLPFDFPITSGWARKRIPLAYLEPFRELQIKIVCTEGALILRDITISGFIDTIELRRY